MKEKNIAYMLWIPSVIGVAGLHRLYLGKVGTGLLWLFTLGLFGVGSIIDLVTLGTQVDAINAKKQLKVISKHTAKETK